MAKPERVAKVLEQEIRAGVLGFGDRLQSEQELVQRFAVSRTTVRKGLEELSARGLITTRVGIGSFVTFKGRTIDDALGWSRALADAGAELRTRVLRIARVEEPETAAFLGHADPAFIAVDRCRELVDGGAAISLERARLPACDALAGLPERGLREGSLQRTLREAGLLPDHGEEWADIELVGTADAAVLGCNPGRAYLRTRRVTRTADGGLVEYVTSLLDPTVFALHLAF